MASAAGDTLPFMSKAPPMTITSFTSAAKSGSSLSASARLVMRPTAISVTSPGLAFTVSMMKRCAGRGSSGRSMVSGISISPRPFSPWMKVGQWPSLRAGSKVTPAPLATGAVICHSRFRKSALRVVISMGALPKTVVTPIRSISGWRCRNRSAMASSTPGSVSNITLCIMPSSICLKRHPSFRRRATET
ncbi:hypothetical protein D3C87_627740 [compost metagenome]